MELGLSEREASIYIELLKRGGLSANSLAKHLGIDRTVSYNTLNRLKEKGIVSEVIKDNKKYFTAAEPVNLLRPFRENLDKAESVVDQLKKIRKVTTVSSSIEVYEGKGGLKTLYEKALKYKNTELLTMGATGRSYEVLQFELPHIEARARNQGIKLKTIVNYSSRNHPFTKSQVVEARYLPKGFDNNATTSIFGDYVSIHILTEKPIILMIKNKEMVKGYTNYFNLLWGIAKPV